MGTIFYGWRRKAGVVTLVITLLVARAWTKSHVEQSLLSFQRGKDASSFERLLSVDGCLVWEKTKSNRPLQIYPDCLLATVENRACGILLEDVRYHWRWQWCGFGSGDYRHEEQFQLPGLTLPGQFWVSINALFVPYWSFVLPLTLVSAWLILWKPRKP